jgi:hypothetical protein
MLMYYLELDFKMAKVLLREYSNTRIRNKLDEL